MLKLQISGLVGDGFEFEAPASMLGSELLEMLRERVAQKPGTRLSLHHEARMLETQKSLKEQGFLEEADRVGFATSLRQFLRFIVVGLKDDSTSLRD